MGNGDGTVHFRDGLAIAQVILFAFPFFSALHFRWTRRICWFTIGGFSIIRCVGAGCMLGTINRNVKSLWAGVFVCESLGVLLLIFTLLEMLEKINKSVPTVHKRVFWIPQLLTWIDIGISIGGFVTVSKKESDQLLPTTFSRAGIAILFVIFLYTAGVWLKFWLKRHQYGQEEYWLAMCTGVCVPFLLIRALYSVIFIITADMTWNAVKGNSAAYLVMTMLPEVAFVGICCYTLWNTAPGSVSEQQGKNLR
ncbi:hypothetical protein CC78DRAFT_576637 [Lojkania enalia]|uniref:DUF7702 domain-containing protein n=1 Tax=Lojkania enalia TaxID=147567 RepID=A0A9P4KG24_9PLEO|nr:hypothetical protein CC78DRAFT_576637 [Didymosphaeria enalia]